jgi:hypothetical protein
LVVTRCPWLAPLLVLTGLVSACAPDRLQAVELAPSTLPEQLLAHWSCDDRLGEVLSDDSGNARNGQLSGGAWLDDGRFAGALHLGQGQFVTVSPFPDVTSSFTVSAWVRLNQYTQNAVNGAEWTTVVSTEASGGWEINVDHLNPTPLLHFGFFIGPATTDYVSHSCAGIALGEWTQIAGVVELSPGSAGATFSVFLNGKECFSLVTPHQIRRGSPMLTIGEWPRGGRFLNGDVDEIAIWSRALVPAEIALLTQAPLTPP